MIGKELKEKLDTIEKNIKGIEKKLDECKKAKIKNIYAEILDSVDCCQKYVDHYNNLKKFRNKSSDENLTRLLDALVNELYNPKALNSSVKVDLEKTTYKPVIPLRQYCIGKKDPKEI